MTDIAPTGRRNPRRTGRYPPGTHRTADTSPQTSYTPGRRIQLQQRPATLEGDPAALFMVGYVPATARPYLAPRCAALCQIAMGLTMAYMLVLML